MFETAYRKMTIIPTWKKLIGGCSLWLALTTTKIIDVHIAGYIFDIDAVSLVASIYVGIFGLIAIMSD